MQGLGKRLQQPPMLAGKAKIPSDLQCVLSFNTQHSRQKQHKTIEHTRTTGSIVNDSFKDFDASAKMSPIQMGSGKKGRHSLFTKPSKIQGQSQADTQLSPPQRTLIVGSAHSEENFAEVQRKNVHMQMDVPHVKAQSKDYINVQSNDKMGKSFDQAQQVSSFKQAYGKPKPIKTKLTNYTQATLSDVSTTVRADSINKRARVPS